jgi:hypothetical protein
MGDRLGGRPVSAQPLTATSRRNSLGCVPSTSRRSMLGPRGSASFVDVHTHADDREPICARLRLYRREIFGVRAPD